MSEYLLGLLTAPAVLAITVGLWSLLKLAAASLPIVSRTMSRDHTNQQRNAIASVVGASERGWHIGGGNNVLIFVRGLDHEKAKEARHLLDHDGPWPTYAKSPEAIPAWKPESKTATPTEEPDHD